MASAKRQAKAPQPAPAAPPDRYAPQLRTANLRVTPMRLAIMQAMEASTQPITAQDVFDAVLAASTKPAKPSSAKAKKPDRVTVYRTLNSLVDAGIAHRIDPGDRVFRFSLTDHAGCTDHHHVHEHPHFVCDACGKVECLEGAEVVIKTKDKPAAPPRKLKQTGAVLHGTCDGCDPEAA